MAVILIPLDSSKHSEYSLNFYLQFVHREGNKIFTCYVADYFGDVGVLEGPTPGRIAQLEEEDKQKAVKVEEYIQQVLKAHNTQGSFVRLKAKEAWHEIIEYGKRINANMIVIGSRGMGKIRRTILGSCSESVLHHSDIPVLVCKNPHML